MNLWHFISCALWIWILGGVVHASFTVPPGELTSISGHSVHVFDGVEKSDHDPSQYHILTLENQLQALIISNPDTEFAAVSLNINVGHNDDSEEFPSLSDLWMSSLLLSSTEYPDGKEYREYLRGHSGKNDANIDREHTNFHFQIDAEHLPEAFHQFAQFFLSPHFNINLMDELLEKYILDYEESSEEKVLSSEDFTSGSNESQEEALSDEGTPGLQNLKTSMKGRIREAVVKFHEQYCSANLIKLVVYGKHPIAKLQQLVVTNFVDIPNKEIIRPAKTALPLEQHHFGKLIRYRGIKKGKTLTMQWQIPGRHSPEYYSTLFELESKGSISYYLRQSGLISEIESMYESDESSFTSFFLVIYLTPEGITRADEIIRAVFQYLQMLRESGPQQWLYKEMRDFQEVEFRFEYSAPLETVIDLSLDMHHVDPKYLRGPVIAEEYDGDYLQSLLDGLTVDNLRIFVGAPDDVNIEYFMNHEWPEEEYHVEELSLETLKYCRNPKLNPAFHLPQPSPWIPTTFYIKPVAEGYGKVPALLAHSDNFKLWFKQDDIFRVPKMSFTLRWITPKGSDSPRSMLYTRALLGMLMESLKGLRDGVANLLPYLEIRLASAGFSIKFSGFDSVLPRFITQILTCITKFTVKEEEFLLARNEMIKRFTHFPHKKPIDLADIYSSSILRKNEHFWWQEEKAMSTMTIEDVDNHWKELLGQANIEMFCHGNVTPDEAMELYKSVQSILENTQPLEEEFIDEAVCLEPGQTLVFSPPTPIKGSKSVAWMHLQTGSLADIRTRALTVLFWYILETILEKFLIEKKLDCTINVSVYYNGESLGLALASVGTTLTPPLLKSRIDYFLMKSLNNLDEMSGELFSKCRDWVIGSMQSRCKHQEDEEAIYYNQILDSQYDFKGEKYDARFLKRVNKGDLIEFVKQNILGNERRRLSIHLWSKNLWSKREAAYTNAPFVYEDEVALKSSLTFCPVKYHNPELESESEESV